MVQTLPTLELTDKFCQSSKPLDGRQTDYFDTIVKGLCLRVSPAGTRTWNLIYSRPGDGKRARMKIGRYPEISLGGDNGARQRARDARAKVGDGGDPIADRKAQDPSQTISDLVDNYLTRHASAKRSGAEIARRLRKNVTSVIGTMKLSDLHRRDLTRCIDKVKDRGAGTEANKVFEDMRAMIRWARGRGDLDENLTEGMKRPTETVERDRLLSSDEIKTMWAALAGADMRESTRRVIRLCLISGQRVGEVTGMTIDEIDLENGIWTIPAARSKNARAHVVPLSPMAIVIVRDQIRAVQALSMQKGRSVPPFVFPGPKGYSAVTGAAIAKAIKRQEIRKHNSTTIMGIGPWTCHDLRRTTATHMEEIGLSPLVVGHVLNHVSITKASITSRVYARYDYMREKREALELWADRLAAITDGKADIVPLRAAS